MRGHLQQRSRDTWRLKVYVGRSADGKRRYLERTVHGSRREAERELPMDRRALRAARLRRHQGCSEA